ncbi:MAG: response regulator transcription factor [Clostridia bacterium]|nr:MAG: response regulator transcription factor [Clostridia bacterium]
MRMFKVLVACDPVQWRETLVAAFSENGFFDVVGGVASGEMLEATTALRPDVVAWKLEEEGDDPAAQVVELCGRCPSVLPVLLVEDPRRLNFLGLLRAGVRGCLPLRLLPRQVAQAVEHIVQAGLVCLPRPGPESLDGERSEGGCFPPYQLTRREYEVLSLLGQNCSNQEIASNLCLAESTVKTHLHNIFRKLGAQNRTEAILAASRLRLPKPD